MVYLSLKCQILLTWDLIICVCDASPSGMCIDPLWPWQCTMACCASGLTSASKKVHPSRSPQVRHRRGNELRVDTLSEERGQNVYRASHAHTRAADNDKGWRNKALSVCFTCIGVCVLQRPLCSGSICVKESRAAKVGQGHTSIIHPPALVSVSAQP